ncbi:zinc finger protein 91 isoform X1 [Parambassis ranga]|uniref:Zinc finger protein 91 isoform X1 n=1 Tax=Parambassis ranga TaxID=210632 RepID=A0A6P7JY93_9TELE|nr:zinc finger protein 91-like isoform X1 [Parambassis ranga]
MDESDAAGSRVDEAENRQRNGDTTSENLVGPSTEDIADGVEDFCCRDCGEAFKEKAAYLDHRHQHTQENVFSDGQLDGLRDAKKDSETRHLCTLCSLSFVELGDLHIHMKECQAQISQKETLVQIKSEISKQHSYECPDCGKSYCVIGHYLNHRRSHSLPAKSVFHDLEHLKKKSFQCEICGRNYSRASALDAHRRCHEEKLIKPQSRSPGDTAPTGDSIESNSNENPADHDPEKVFTCSCGKTFSALMRLKTHQRFSRNRQCSPEEIKQKPKKSDGGFYCSECKKSFNGHIALFNHQRWHANQSTDSAQRFSCEQCGKVFMSLSFYYRHQRTAHSDETPAKSFLHQVCQVQKKAIECKDCGLKFSRASALHSHQLHHTDVFKETEKVAQVHSTLPHQDKVMESESNEIHSLEASAEEKKYSGNLLPPSVAEEEPHINETEDDMDSYEPGDFNVQVISASESEDEEVQDLNPDLELLCESDQEVRDDCDAETTSGKLVSKPEMDLKIVQIDFEHADEQGALIAREAQSNTAGGQQEERFDCPDCYRWFTSPSSLRVHRMWHGVRMRRQQTQGQSVAAYTCDTCGHEASSYAEHCNHMQTHNDQNLSSDVLYQAEGLERKNLTCSECGKVFSRLSALVSHQLHHPKKKQFQCPDCMVSYLHAASLCNHMKTCSAQKKENVSVIKKEYNPKKTLLGPKLYHCEQCGKGFWSLGAYSHHKQNPTECADLRLRKGVVGSAHGHQRSTIKVACPVCGRKFRHKGIMALHMRKHENGNHKCEVCSRSFRLFSSLLRHQVVHSNQLLPPPIKSFQHQVEQLKKNTYSCPDCGKLFSRAKALQFHMKSHGYETGYAPSSPRSTVTLEDLQCATCLAHFSSKVSLRAHQKLCIKRDRQEVEKTENVGMNLHDGSVDAGVDNCDQLRLNTKVKNEMDSGTVKLESGRGEGNLENPSTTSLKYKCNKCDRSFSVVGALNFHKRIHSKGYKSVSKANLVISVMCKKPKQEEPSKGLFHCSECGRRFMSNSALGSHKRWHKDKKCSPVMLKDNDKSVSCKTQNGRFECKKCGKTFFNHRVLQRHQMFNPQCQTKAEPESNKSVEVNSTPEQFSCLECNKKFVQSSLLAAHYEHEHSKGLEAAGTRQDGLLDCGSEQADIICSGSDPTSLTLKLNAHQCPVCLMTFMKARGLRAHKWQAHSKKGPTASKSEGDKTEDSSAVEGTTATVKTIFVSRGGGQINSDPPAEKSVTCLNCGKLYSSLDALLNHKKVCTDVKHEIQTSEATAEVPPPLGHLSDHTVKYLFKCDKCGKAFQTEEHLETHKAKAKSRPYCCALCCHGFWTENQLQQHLTWHDEVRCRLPNELRYKLSAALNSKPLNPNLATAEHRGTSSSLSPTNRPTLNPYTYHCSVCPRTFRKIQDLIDHHQECIRDYKGQTYTPAAAAVSPELTTGLTCIECGITFCQETDLQQHYSECWCK